MKSFSYPGAFRLCALLRPSRNTSNGYIRGRIGGRIGWAHQLFVQAQGSRLKAQMESLSHEAFDLVAAFVGEPPEDPPPPVGPFFTQLVLGMPHLRGVVSSLVRRYHANPVSPLRFQIPMWPPMCPPMRPSMCSPMCPCPVLPFSGSVLGGGAGGAFPQAWGADDATRLEFIRPYGQLGVKYGNMLPFVQAPASWANIPWESFADGADTVITCKLLEKVTNPVAKVAVEYMSAVRVAGGGAQSWYDHVCRQVLAARCAAPHWASRGKRQIGTSRGGLRRPRTPLIPGLVIITLFPAGGPGPGGEAGWGQGKGRGGCGYLPLTGLHGGGRGDYSHHGARPHVGCSQNWG